MYVFVCTCILTCAATPIDLLAKYVNTTEDEVDIEIQEPYHLLRVGTCTCFCVHLLSVIVVGKFSSYRLLYLE